MTVGTNRTTEGLSLEVVKTLRKIGLFDAITRINIVGGNKDT